MASTLVAQTTDALLPCSACGAAVKAGTKFCPACGAEQNALRAGEILDGKYEILDKIAEGGMGEVYRARHLHLEEIRIVKVMKSIGAQDEAHRRRFVEEARLATRLRHPHVAALYDFAPLPTGGYYMVWEHIDGTTLLERLRRGRMEIPEAVEIAGQVLSGLAEIHRLGVVHRDISPDNIMIVERDGARTAKIIDLGIAKNVTADSAAMTATGVFLGKLKYCSPEQAGALGADERLDGRSDLYSFGAVLYQMLSGRPLFESPTPEGYIAKHLQEIPPPLRLHDERAGPALAAIVARALEKDRRNRYSSAAEFAAALSSIPPITRTMPTSRSAAADADATQRLSTPPGTTVVVRRRARWPVAVASASVVIGLLALSNALRLTRPESARIASVPPPPSRPVVPPVAVATGNPGSAPLEPVRPRLEENVERGVPPPGATPRRQPRTSPGPSPVPPPPISTPAAELSVSAPAPDRAAAPEDADARKTLRTLRTAAETGTRRDVDAFVDFVTAYVAEHPASPLAAHLREDLPLNLKAQAQRAEKTGHPWRARRIHEIYSRLPFVLPDDEVEGRKAKLARETSVDVPEPANDLRHVPARFAPAHRPLEVRAEWTGSTPPGDGEVVFRNRLRGEWNRLPFTIEGKSLEASVPAASVLPPLIEYYLEVRDQSGAVRRSGSPESPFLVRVRR